MSPEQVKGRQVDGRSDIFSLGVILYDLLTGEMPFSGQNVTTVIYKIINENPIPPRELDATIHPGLSYVVCKALAKSPDERYQTCRELADDLRNFKCLGTAPSATIKVNVPTLQIPEMERAAAPPVESPAPPAAPLEAAAMAPASAYQKLLASPMGWALIALLGVVILGIFGGARYLYLHKKNAQTAARVGQLLVESNVPGAQISVDGQSEPNWVTHAPFPLFPLARTKWWSRKKATLITSKR
jgi:serine/threonine-protein kinase